MRRREFITLLGGTAAGWLPTARAQQSLRIAKIGHLECGLPSTSPNLLAAFRQGLRELGYVEGRNVYFGPVKEESSHLPVGIRYPFDQSSGVRL
jgi:hypothetical protein